AARRAGGRAGDDEPAAADRPRGVAGRCRDPDPASGLDDPFHLYAGGARRPWHHRGADPPVGGAGGGGGHPRRSGAGTGRAGLDGGMMPAGRSAMTDTTHLEDLHRRILWLSCWTVHNANHLRERDEGEVRVGGNQASSASMAAIMTALYFHVLRPQDRVAVKPHAGPGFHAIQYLMGNLPLEKLRNFRGYGGTQSYPSRTKDGDDVDFSTGSVGLGAAMPIFASITQDYLAGHGWARGPEGRMVALIGDAELDEGNIY